MSYTRQKGTAFETAVVKYLQSCGFTTPRRVVMHGANDQGDVWLGDNPVCPDVVIECKNYAQKLSYGLIEDFLKEAHTEYLNATKKDTVDNYSTVLIAKIINLGVADSWIVWKNNYGISVRARLGDVINIENFKDISNESERIVKLKTILKNGDFNNAKESMYKM